MTGQEAVCAICGRILPNRWAVAGRCEADGCGAAFCALHWHTGNRLCRRHGWKGNGGNKMDKVGETKMPGEAELRERARTELPEREKQSVMRQVAAFAVTIGKGAVALVDRIRGVKDPDAAISALDAQLAANRARREPLASRYEALYREIAAKKKNFLAAPPPRKKILELELRGLLSEYQGIERQLAVYLENERVINTVRARTLELTAMGLRKISEKDIDKLTDDLTDAAGEADDVSDAMRELEKAGRRSVADDADAFADALAGFDENFADEPAEAAGGEKAADDPFAGFEEPKPEAGKEDGELA